MENRILPINAQLNRQVPDQIAKNREKLKPIIETIIMCGQQNISLRGHRDDARYLEDLKNHPGNLQAILTLLYKCGRNPDFDEHFKNAPKIATYPSKTS